MSDAIASTPSFAQADALPRRWLWLAVLFLVVATALAYSNSFRVPFLLDDEGSILTNPTLRDWRTVLTPPGDTGETVGGRPLLNITLAINYAISGTHVWSYHVANLLIHLCAGLALFGLVRRTLAFCGWSARRGFFAALAIASLWLLHPLQTESVTYIVQRAESLMALFYLLTLYCFARGAQAVTSARKWFVLSVGACALGMATKEVMVSAPILVLLYDRAFVAGTFREAFKRRTLFYGALAATWLVLAACLAGSGFRGGTAGFGTPVTWWSYALRQCEGIVIYLKLVFWPAPLVFDYGVEVVRDPWSVWPQIVCVAALAAATFWAFFKHPRIGFLGLLFFAVLAPSSSVIPVVSQTLAEHRMYLPLAAVLSLIVVACCKLPKPVSIFAACGAALAFGVVTWLRNEDMQSISKIWSDTVAKMPASHRAQNNLGCALIDEKKYEEGIAHCREAARLKPDYGEAYANIGYGLSGAKRYAEAIPFYMQGVALMRKTSSGGLDRVLLNMGMSLHEVGRDSEAQAAFEDVVRLNPQSSAALNNLGNYQFLAGHYAAAKALYARATVADPQFAEAWYDLGNAVVALGEPWSEAERLYRHALALSPDLVFAQDNLGRLLLAMNRPQEAAAFLNKVARENPTVVSQLNAARAFLLSGKTAEAITVLQNVITSQSDNVEAHYLLGNAYYRNDQRAEAIAEYRQAIRINPFAVEPHGNLGGLLASLGQWDEAIVELNAAIRLKPDYAEAHYNLANALSQSNRDAEARPHYEEALHLKPQFAQAHFNYARLLVRAGEKQAAREHVEEALRLNPNYTEARVFLEDVISK